MTGEMLLNQVEVVREITIKKMETIPHEIVDIVPKGFHNTIRWNYGHILIVQDQLASHFAGLPSQLPPDFVTFFGNRTKPADWILEPPSLEALSAALKQQTVYIKEALGNRLEEKAVKPFVRLGYAMNTIGEILNFSLHHEGIHIGMIQSIERAIEGSKLG